MTAAQPFAVIASAGHEVLPAGVVHEQVERTPGGSGDRGRALGVADVADHVLAADLGSRGGEHLLRPPGDDHARAAGVKLGGRVAPEVRAATGHQRGSPGEQPVAEDA